jgi:outer membrane lipoprotein-sorting protein
MSHKSILVVLMILIISSFLVSACESARTPADVIVDYLEALAESDQTAAVSNSCVAWEEQARAEGASFINVEVSLKDLDCQVQDQSKTEATVLCTGSFLFSYDAGEEQELDLFGRVFSLVMESGEWRMCGYKMVFN